MNRLPQLDGLRGLAALYVVLHHAWLTVWPTDAGRLGPGAPFGTGVLAYGHFAVAVFIVLSGFCLGLPVAERGWKLPGGARAFFRRRARRILPPYYAAVAFSLLLVGTRLGDETGTHWDLSVPVDASGVLAALLLLQNVVGQSQINHVFWSIAVEAQIYLLFPALIGICAARGVRAGVGAAAAAAGVLTAVVVVLPVVGPVVLTGLTPQFLLLFALGVAAAAVVRASTRPIPWGRTAGVGTVLFVGLLLLLGRDLSFLRLAALDLLVGLVVAAGLVALCRAPRSRAATTLGARPLAGLGRMAYSTYLVHAPILQLFWLSWLAPRGLADGAQFALLVGVGVPAALAVSYGFFLVCERPFVRPRRVEAEPDGALAARAYS